MSNNFLTILLILCSTVTFYVIITTTKEKQQLPEFVHEMCGHIARNTCTGNTSICAVGPTGVSISCGDGKEVLKFGD